jgi:hypothetical protein
MTLDELRKLAGIKEDQDGQTSGGLSPLSTNGTKNAKYQRKHNIRPGTDEWFKLWFSREPLTGENPRPKK